MFRFGDGNLDVDPRFVDPSSDFRLLPSSPCIGAGPNGLDMGAFVPAGVSISGEPDSISMSDRATLSVGGPGITHYRFCLNQTNGPWSEVFSIAEKPLIELSGLMDGQQYTVYAQGKNSAGVWQTEPTYTSSKKWKVQLTPTLIQQDVEYAAEFALYQNTPNPFNPSTRIEFELPISCYVALQVFDVQGRHIETLARGRYPAGKHRVTWNAAEFPSGIYLYHLAAGDLSSSRRMILVK